MITQGNSSAVLEISAPDGNYAFDLGKNQQISITGTLGETIFSVENNAVFIQSSPCANKICIHSGKISKPGQWLCCAPNRIFAIIKAAGKNAAKEQNKIDAFAF